MVYKCIFVCYVVKVEKIGCDVVSIDGFEVVGYFGEDDVIFLILILLICDVICLLIIVFGGFVDGCGLVGCLGFGVDGMNMGICFVVI